jgi:hypothetical protein
MSKTITVNSSHGYLICDETGTVIEKKIDCGTSCKTCITDIAKFDFEEWEKRYNRDLDSEIDILDLGCWTDKGKYGEPEHDWRTEFRPIGYNNSSFESDLKNKFISYSILAYSKDHDKEHDVWGLNIISTSMSELEGSEEGELESYSYMEECEINGDINRAGIDFKTLRLEEI